MDQHGKGVNHFDKFMIAQFLKNHIVVSKVGKDVLYEGIICLKKVMRWGFISFKQSVKGLEDLRRVWFPFFKVVDDFNDVYR